MATNTAVAPRRTTPDPTRHVWQVPAFLLGAAAFVSAWQGLLPIGPPDAATDFARDLAALRTAYERVTPDRDELKELLARVAGGVDLVPEHGLAARFALGSGYVRLAELTPGPDEALEHWKLARQHFELINEKQFTDPNDPPKWAFRFAKARAAVGMAGDAPPDKLRPIITLLAAPPIGEEPGEAGRLRADLALRLSPPDLQTAKAALREYVLSTGIATPRSSLARAKLALGDVYLRLKEPEQARTWLQQIEPSEAPPDVIAPAKALLARVKMKEEDYRGAAADWEAVRNLPGTSPALRAVAAYHLGWCKVKTLDPAAAAPLFEEAVKGDGPEATAAAVRLADLYLKGADAAKHVAAVELLARAVRGASTYKQFQVRNPLVFVAELQETFDLAVSVLNADGAYETALKALDSYAAVSPPGRDREKRAEVLAAWAGSLQKQGGDFKPKATEAAAAYESLAGSQSADSAKADALRRAAAMHTLAGEPAKAATTLQKATPLTLPDAERTAVWLDLAHALIAANRPEEAWPALNQAMSNGTTLSTATRYRLARLFADSGHTGLLALGKNLFEQVAKQEPDGVAEQEFHERALVELAHEFIKANNYPDADIWLRKQLHLYPKGPEAPLGRLFLGICLQQRAAASGLNPATATQMREEAARLFKQVIAEVDAKASQAKKLDNRDAWLRLQAALRLLQAYQQLQKPNELLAEADPLLDRHRGTVEELIIKSLMYHAFKQKNQPGLALQTRDQMKELFDRLPRTAFVAEKGEYSYDYWKTVWFPGRSSRRTGSACHIASSGVGGSRCHHTR